MCVRVLFVVVVLLPSKQMRSSLYMMDHFFVFVTAVFMHGMLQSSWFYASCRFKIFPTKFWSLLYSCTDSLCPPCALDSEAKRTVQGRDKAAFSDLKKGIKVNRSAGSAGPNVYSGRRFVMVFLVHVTCPPPLAHYVCARHAPSWSEAAVQESDYRSSC